MENLKVLDSFSLVESLQKHFEILNTISFKILSFTLLLLGYSTYCFIKVKQSIDRKESLYLKAIGLSKFRKNRVDFIENLIVITVSLFNGVLIGKAVEILMVMQFKIFQELPLWY